MARPWAKGTISSRVPWRQSTGTFTEGASFALSKGSFTRARGAGMKGKRAFAMAGIDSKLLSRTQLPTNPSWAARKATAPPID